MVIFINQIRMKIGVMFGSPETTTGGNALKFYASVRLDIRRTGTIKKGEEAIGNETKVKVVKNKVAPPFKTAEFDILFGEGISRQGEIIDMGVNARILDKSGAWYAYNGEKIGQGRDNAREFLRENPELAREIENKVRESLGIPLLPESRASADAAKVPFRQKGRPAAMASPPARQPCCHGHASAVAQGPGAAPAGRREHSRAELERKLAAFEPPSPASWPRRSTNCRPRASSTSSGWSIRWCTGAPPSWGRPASARSCSKKGLDPALVRGHGGRPAGHRAAAGPEVWRKKFGGERARQMPPGRAARQMRRVLISRGFWCDTPSPVFGGRAARGRGRPDRRLSLLQPQHQLQVLHRGAAGALAQVVQPRDQHGLAVVVGTRWQTPAAPSCWCRQRQRVQLAVGRGGSTVTHSLPA
jgi:hypothetical protein